MGLHTLRTINNNARDVISHVKVVLGEKQTNA